MAQINPRKSAETYWLHRLQSIESIDLYSDKGAIAYAQRVMDEELAAMERVLCDVRSRRNSLSPISRLPTAILAHIFSFYAKIEPHSPWVHGPDLIQEHSAPHELGWIKVSWVCRHWRDTALQAPSLWANIKLGLQSWRWVEEFVRRAKVAPRTLEGKNLSRELIQKVRDGGILPDGLSDVAHLRISGRAEAFAELLTSPAPILRSLELLSAFGSGTEDETDRPIICLSDDLFAGSTPNLIHVSLIDCYLPWTSPLYKGLTVLDIRINPIDGTNYPDTVLFNFEQFLVTLREMLFLERLVLHFCLPSLPNHRAMPTGYHAVDLQHLITLWLDGPMLDCAAFIRYVQFPPSATVRLDCSTADIDGDIGDFLPDLQALGKRHAVSKPWSMLQVRYSRYTFHVTASTNCDDERKWYREVIQQRRADPTEPGADIYFSMNLQTDPADDGLLSALWFQPSCHRIIENLCQALPLNDLQGLSVQYCPDPHDNGDMCLTPRQWTDFFGCSVKIERVHTSTSLCTSLINALVIDAVPDPEQGSHQAAEQPQLPFPNLISLCLLDSPGTFAYDPAFGRLLLRKLTERKDAGAGLERLYLHRRHVNDGDSNIIPDLLRIVPTVLTG